MWISALELFKAEQLFVVDDRRGLEMGASTRRGSWLGVPWSHPHFVLEFSLISVVSVCWGNERKKERKNIEKEMGSERKWRKERRKKCSEIEREETLPLKTNTFLPYSRVAIERKTISETKFYLLSSCRYMVKKSHTTIFIFYFFVEAYTVNNFLTMDPWLLATNNYQSLMIK